MIEFMTNWYIYFDEYPFMAFVVFILIVAIVTILDKGERMQEIISNGGILDFFRTSPLANIALFLIFVCLVGFLTYKAGNGFSKLKETDTGISQSLDKLTDSIVSLNVKLENDKVIRDERDDKYEYLFERSNGQLEQIKEQNNQIFTKLSEHDGFRCREVFNFEKNK